MREANNAQRHQLPLGVILLQETKKSYQLIPSNAVNPNIFKGKSLSSLLNYIRLKLAFADLLVSSLLLVTVQVLFGFLLPFGLLRQSKF